MTYIIVASAATGLIAVLITQFIVERDNKIPDCCKDLIVLGSAVTALFVVLSVIIAADIVIYLS